ncbi:aspartyl protease family protein At5g10770-like [Syzygium oleosum]|uniref:aspartyl protease family protein At5g10770-like n=1 Tax=Syzygium oleosum TaxID=219896 RepID=UPI0011D29290|nr:aspartyl protease family protein At5g10770-like [Syzygium oleosum]
MTTVASPCFSFLIKILLYVSLLCLLCVVHGADEITVPVSSLFPSPNCKASTSNVNSTVKLVHKHGPCSPLFQGEPVNHTQLLLEDIARVEWIESKYSGADATNSPKDSAVSLEAKYSPNAAGYFVTIGVGTPKQDLTLLFDTGSALTWTQCKPCAESCSEPIFDPSRSSSYANISFSDPSCLLLRSGTGHKPLPSGSTCSYRATYLSGAYSEGFFATETLTLSPIDAITRFKFGCGQKSEKIKGFAGLLGLARDEISLFGQSATKYGRSFSYCLPPSLSSTGYLTLGTGSRTSASVSFTPLITIPRRPLFYGIKITGISVGGKQLDIEETVFSTANTVIDSGATFTRLPTKAYDALRSAFRQGMLKYKMSDPTPTLDTCYDLRGSTSITIPRIRFSFSGSVEVDLDPRGVLFGTNEKMCLAFAPSHPNTDLSIYGNVQQRTFEVVYDVAGGRIGFRAKGCS